MRRVPVSFTADDVTRAIQAKGIVRQLTGLIEDWRQKAEEAVAENATGKPPCTYEKALQLLAELSVILSAVADSNSLKDD